MSEGTSTGNISLHVSHKGTHYSLSLLPDSTLQALQIRLEELTSVPPPLQKLLYKGKKNLNQEEAKTATLESVGLKDGTKITMLGSTEGELGAMQKAIDEKRRKEGIIAKRAGGKVSIYRSSISALVKNPNLLLQGAINTLAKYSVFSVNALFISLQIPQYNTPRTPSIPLNRPLSPFQACIRSRNPPRNAQAPIYRRNTHRACTP